MTLAEVAQIVCGTLADAPDVYANVGGPVVVDSREVSGGSLFVALPGDRVDGHEFAGAAVAAGAVGVLAARPVGVPAVVVDDVLTGLGRLAAAVVRGLPDLTVVGLTGSSGKTSTKDLLAQVLSRLGPTVAPPGSYNNEIGLPLTLLRADEGTRQLVAEMGARGRGHIRYLAELATPRIGVVLNIGTAHVGEFGGRPAIAAAKAELVEALPAADDGGVAVLNADDELVAGMASRTSARVVTFGGEGGTVGCDVCGVDVELDDSGRARFLLRTPEGSAPVHLRLYGEHHVSNALATAAVARALGMSVADTAEALSAAVAQSRWRMEVTERPDGVTVINDAYNANPESMRAALRALRAMARGRRTWAVLGEMRELGELSAVEHEALGRAVRQHDVSRLLVVGEAARPVLAGATEGGSPGGQEPRGEGPMGEEYLFVPDAAAAIEVLRRDVGAGDVVLVKASRATGLEVVAEQLLGAAAGADRPGEPA